MTNEGIFPKTDGDILYASEVNSFPRNGKIFTDLSGGSTTNTSEAKIGEVIIPANGVSNGIIILASGKGIRTDADGSAKSYSVTLRGGENSTITDNTLYKTITRSQVFNDNTDEVQLGWTMIYYISDLTWTNENYIQIGGNSNPGSVYCDSLIIIGL